MVLAGLDAGHGSHDESAKGVPWTRCWPDPQAPAVHGTQAPMAPPVEKYPGPHWAQAPAAVM
jgi:hypothetical protein